MATALTASFTLRLVDQLSGPLRALQERFEALRGAASRFGAAGFREAAGAIDQARSAASGLAGELGGITRAADVTGQAMRRMAEGADAQVSRLRRAWAGFRGGGSNRVDDPALARWAGGSPLRDGALPANWARGETSATRLPGAPSEGGGLSETIAAVGAAEAIRGLFEGVRRAAEYESPLVHSAVAANLSGAQAAAFIAERRAQYDRLSLATGVRNTDIAETGYNLQLTGMNKGLIAQIMPAAAMAATAYRTNMADVGGVAYALNENLGIKGGDMAQALATLGLAGRTGHFTLDKMAQYFPQEAALAGSFGMTGMGAAQQLAAAMQISLKNVGMNDPGKAATNMQDFLQYIASPIAGREFKKYGGVDLDKTIKEGLAKGISPLESIITKTMALTGRDRMQIGKLFHNAEAAQFVVAMIQHRKEYLALLATLQKVDVNTIQNDFAEVARHTDFAVQQFDASMSLLTQRVGFAFIPVMRLATGAMLGLTRGFMWMDEHVPGASTAVVSLGGGLLALVAGAGAWMLVREPLVAAFRLVGMVIGPVVTALRFLGVTLLEFGAEALLAIGPVGWIIAGIIALAVAASELYLHWDSVGPWFHRLWDDVTDAFDVAGQWILSWIGPAAIAAIAALHTAWNALSAFFNQLWLDCYDSFSAFTTWVDGWTGGAVTASVNAIKTAWGGLKAFFVTLWSDIEGAFTGFTDKVDAWANKHPLVSPYSGKPRDPHDPFQPAPFSSVPPPSAKLPPGFNIGAPQPVNVHTTVTAPPGYAVTTTTDRSPYYRAARGPTLNRP